jgi:hypothetical protein
LIPAIADLHGMDNEEVLEILLCDFYLNGLSMVKCSEKFGITYRQVQKILRKNNVEIRPRGFQKKVEEKDDKPAEEIINTVDENQKSEAENKVEDAIFNIKVNCKGGDNSDNAKIKSSNKTIVFCEQTYSNEKFC